jgi:hypothetical protein
MHVLNAAHERGPDLSILQKVVDSTPVFLELVCVGGLTARTERF